MTIFADTSDYQHITGAQLAAAGFTGEVRKISEGMGLAGGAGAAWDVASSKGAGLLVGGYHFARPLLSMPEQQAQFFLSHLPAGLDFIVLDIEVDGGSTTGVWALRFLNYCQAHLPFGVRAVVVYAGLSYASQWLDLPGMGNYPLWVADYFADKQADHSFPSPQQWPQAAMWQYTDGYNAPGIGNIDASVAYPWFLARLQGAAIFSQEPSMIALDPSTTDGIWYVTPTGAVYTIGSAPWLGGLNEHPEYAAGGPNDPAVGIAPWRDPSGNWGYVIVTFNGSGIATYHFERNGRER